MKIAKHSTRVHHVNGENKLSNVIKLHLDAINDREDKRCDIQNDLS